MTVLVLVGGVVLWSQTPVEYQARATLVVLPQGGAAEAASYYDTLSRGQIATTFAEILSLRADPAAAAGGDGSDAEVTVEVVPDTSLIELSATAGAPGAAEAAADAALGQAQPYFDQLGAPYAVSVVEPAAGTAERAGLVLEVFAAVVAAVALIAGLASYLAVRALQHSRRQSRPLAASRPAEPGPAARETAARETAARETAVWQPEQALTENDPAEPDHLVGRSADPVSQQSAR
ncbi:hypothetical protein SAMN06893097_1057 [Geodermatophilus sabuli]|uniref:Capsular polysaccharide biosynthesis protein n=1 Tax=Geodermatophilus sabuli TaxID=1564158 RepID=A0A285ECB2_9ACTN|nr:hypothetical protein SAMN06893097_1057 [Geodermatophilus sabuli]